MFLLVLKILGKDDCYISFDSYLDWKRAREILKEQEDVYYSNEELSKNKMLLEYMFEQWEKEGIIASYFEDVEYYFVG